MRTRLEAAVAAPQKKASDPPSHSAVRTATDPQTACCPFDDHEGVWTDDYEATEIPGLFAAGNVLRDVQLACVAAAEGARAAFGINRALTREALR